MARKIIGRFSPEVEDALNEMEEIEQAELDEINAILADLAEDIRQMSSSRTTGLDDWDYDIFGSVEEDESIPLNFWEEAELDARTVDGSI